MRAADGRVPLYEIGRQTRMANGVTLVSPLHVTTSIEKAVAFGAIAYATGLPPGRRLAGVR
jgi:hypothetical protein